MGVSVSGGSDAYTIKDEGRKTRKLLEATERANKVLIAVTFAMFVVGAVQAYIGWIQISHMGYNGIDIIGGFALVLLLLGFLAGALWMMFQSKHKSED